MLCFTHGGEQNCDYTWEVIESRGVFEETYVMYAKGSPNFIDDTSTVGGFLVTSEQTKKVIVTKVNTVKTIIHEIEHIKCHLDFEIHQELTIRNNCNDIVDDRHSGFKEFLTHMPCDTLEIQALNHEKGIHRLMALAEHGGRC